MFKGIVSFISPGVDEQTRTFLLKADIENSVNQLKSGMFAVVDLILQTRQDKPVIPDEALVATREGDIVFIVKDNMAHRRPVEIGLRRPGRVQVVRGIEEGQSIVRSGQMHLADGIKVTVEKQTDEANPSTNDAKDQSDASDGYPDQGTTK